MKKRLLVLLGVVIVIAACSSDDTAVTGVVLNHTTLDIAVVDSPVTLEPTISPADASNKKVSWTVDQPAVASITSEGVVTPKSVGTAIVTVTTEDGGFTAKCTVNVSAAKTTAVSSVALDEDELSLVAGGETRTLTATVFPSTATNKTVNWSTSNSAVATVSAGVVTPLTVGTAVIAVIAEDGGYTDQCTVTVTAQTVAVTGVSLDETELDLIVGGDTATLTPTVSPSTATNKNVVWSSDTVTVATVSNGVVTPVASGSAIISVTTEDGSKSASCTVSVAPESKNWAIKTSRSASSYVSVADLSITQNFTLEVWVKPEAVSADQFVISKQKEAVGTNQFRLGFESNNAYFMMSDSTGGGGLWIDDNTGYALKSSVAAGEWVHLAVTKNGTSFVLYINGENKDTFTSSSFATYTGAELLEFGAGVAKNGSSAVSVLDGTMDEIRIWDIARSAENIAADMSTPISSTHSQYSHLIAYYQFDDGTGTTVTDTKGSHPGTLVNSPTWVESTIPAGQ